MKKHSTRKNLELSSIEKDEKALSAEAYFKASYGDVPRWAVLLSGLRNREGLTQKEFGKKIGVAQYHISRMERGARAIGKEVAKRIASVFNIDYRLLL